MATVGVIGCGYWGPNLIRNFNQIPEVKIKYACDLDGKRLQHIQSLYSEIQVTKDYREILKDNSVDAVCIATPVHTHFPLAKDALLSGKHVLIEKPLTACVKEAEELIELSERNKKVLMVDHTFEFTVAVNKIKEIIERNELGNIFYINSDRLSLGLFQKDINVVWDLAPHDISIMIYVLRMNPISVSAQGQSHILKGIEDVSMVKVQFPQNIIAFLRLSWLDPCKVRKMTIVGSQKMLVYDDVEQIEKIKIYNKRVDVPKYYDTFGDFHFSYKYGDIHIPFLTDIEPLKMVCAHFYESFSSGNQPRTHGGVGLKVVKVLEAAQQSIKQNGKEIEIT